MEADPGVIVGLLVLGGFLATIVWAELHTRRKRRRTPRDEPRSPLPAPPRSRSKRED